MPGLGEQFKAAREAQGWTVGEVAEKTHIKPTHISAMERNDFGVLASPVYARGFIKIYAECLDLDPEPLLRAYQASAEPEVRPKLQADAPEPGGLPRESMLQVLQRGWRRGVDVARDVARRLDRGILIRALGWAAGLLVAVLLLAGVGRAVRAFREREPRPHAAGLDRRSERLRDEFRRVEMPAEPYVDSDAFGAPEGSPR